MTKSIKFLMLTALAFVPSREAAGAMIEIANTPNYHLKELASWWLLNRKGNDWRAYDVEGAMQALGLDKVAISGGMRGASAEDAAVSKRLVAEQVLPGMR